MLQRGLDDGEDAVNRLVGFPRPQHDEGIVLTGGRPEPADKRRDGGQGRDGLVGDKEAAEALVLLAAVEGGQIRLAGEKTYVRLGKAGSLGKVKLSRLHWGKHGLILTAFAGLCNRRHGLSTENGTGVCAPPTQARPEPGPRRCAPRR